MPCFGLEQDLSVEMCRRCHFKVDCEKFMGCRAQTTKLDEVKFNLVPDKISATVLADPEAASADGLYAICHQSIFECESKNRLGKLTQRVIDTAARCDCGLPLFMSAIMYGHKISSYDQPFWPTMLVGDGAISKIEQYRAVCAKKLGCFDMTALGQLNDGVPKDIQTRMFNSELIFGSWVVGFKTTKGGSPFSHLYLAKELSLDPMWLAIEPTYLECVFKPYIKEATPTTAVLRRHRFEVSQVRKALLKDRNAVRAIFQLRADVLPRVITRVLNKLSIMPSGILMADKTIVDVSKFWLQLGIVLQHLNCLRVLNGIPGFSS